MKNKIQMLLKKEENKSHSETSKTGYTHVTPLNCYFGLHALQIMLRNWEKYGGGEKKKEEKNY